MSAREKPLHINIQLSDVKVVLPREPNAAVPADSRDQTSKNAFGHSQAAE